MMYDDIGSVKASRYIHLEMSIGALLDSLRRISLVVELFLASKDVVMNWISGEERDGRVAIKESFGYETNDSSTASCDGVPREIPDVKLLKSWDRTSSEFGQFPPLRFVKDRARSLESSWGKKGTVRILSMAQAPTAMRCVLVMRSSRTNLFLQSVSVSIRAEQVMRSGRC